MVTKVKGRPRARREGGREGGVSSHIKMTVVIATIRES